MTSTEEIQLEICWGIESFKKKDYKTKNFHSLRPCTMSCDLLSVEKLKGPMAMV